LDPSWGSTKKRTMFSDFIEGGGPFKKTQRSATPRISPKRLPPEIGEGLEKKREDRERQGVHSRLLATNRE